MATKEGGMKKRNKSKSLKCGVYIILLAKCTQKGLCQCVSYVSIPLKISIYNMGLDARNPVFGGL